MSTLVIGNHYTYALSVTDSVGLEVMMDATTLPDLLGYDDLASLDLTRHGLDRLIESGDFGRIAPGLFLRAGLADATTAAWIAVAAKKPHATLSLLTAPTVAVQTDDKPPP